MADLAIEGRALGVGRKRTFMQRFRAVARYLRVRRGRRRAARLVLAETLDPRMLEDVGIDPYLARYHEWLHAAALLGGRPG